MVPVKRTYQEECNRLAMALAIASLPAHSYGVIQTRSPAAENM